ncbi:MAG: hypothetical protein ACRDP3_04505 [Streptomyces sp.]|uniref:hypothetical protein n=1 Tax=Streptomyces sp. TaxID=1931 RepID=UPI003D6C4893
MEPRELWDRHTVLAKAFCHSDEEVRGAQTTLDDAQASRARSLAAFAVVVGNDRAVAEMLGLPEREVRIARRTVGREDARTLADDLLMPPAPLPSHAATSDETVRPPEQQHQPPQQQQQQQQQPQQQSLGHPQAQYQTPFPSQAQSQAQSQPHVPVQEQHPQMYEHAHLPDHMGWSPVQDAVLVDGWQTGVDMEILALELGTDLRRLIARAQYLSAHGRLFVAAGEDVAGRQGGRHRREGGQHHPGIPGQQMGSPGEMLLPDGLVPDGYGGYWANWNEMLPAPQG